MRSLGRDSLNPLFFSDYSRLLFRLLYGKTSGAKDIEDFYLSLEPSIVLDIEMRGGRLRQWYILPVWGGVYFTGEGGLIATDPKQNAAADDDPDPGGIDNIDSTGSVASKDNTTKKVNKQKNNAPRPLPASRGYADEKELIKGLSDCLEKYQYLPIIGHNVRSFDIPHLKKYIAHSLLNNRYIFDTFDTFLLLFPDTTDATLTGTLPFFLENNNQLRVWRQSISDGGAHHEARTDVIDTYLLYLHLLPFLAAQPSRILELSFIREIAQTDAHVSALFGDDHPLALARRFGSLSPYPDLATDLNRLWGLTDTDLTTPDQNIKKIETITKPPDTTLPTGNKIIWEDNIGDFFREYLDANLDGIAAIPGQWFANWIRFEPELAKQIDPLLGPSASEILAWENKICAEIDPYRLRRLFARLSVAATLSTAHLPVLNASLRQSSSIDQAMVNDRSKNSSGQKASPEKKETESASSLANVDHIYFDDDNSNDIKYVGNHSKNVNYNNEKAFFIEAEIYRLRQKLIHRATAIISAATKRLEKSERIILDHETFREGTFLSTEAWAMTLGHIQNDRLSLPRSIVERYLTALAKRIHDDRQAYIFDGEAMLATLLVVPIAEITKGDACQTSPLGRTYYAAPDAIGKRWAIFEDAGDFSDTFDKFFQSIDDVYLHKSVIPSRDFDDEMDADSKIFDICSWLATLFQDDFPNTRGSSRDIYRRLSFNATEKTVRFYLACTYLPDMEAIWVMASSGSVHGNEKKLLHVLGLPGSEVNKSRSNRSLALHSKQVKTENSTFWYHTHTIHRSPWNHNLYLARLGSALLSTIVSDRIHFVLCHDKNSQRYLETMLKQDSVTKGKIGLLTTENLLRDYSINQALERMAARLTLWQKKKHTAVIVLNGFLEWLIEPLSRRIEGLEYDVIRADTIPLFSRYLRETLLSGYAQIERSDESDGNYGNEVAENGGVSLGREIRAMQSRAEIYKGEHFFTELMYNYEYLRLLERLFQKNRAGAGRVITLCASFQPRLGYQKDILESFIKKYYPNTTFAPISDSPTENGANFKSLFDEKDSLAIVESSLKIYLSEKDPFDQGRDKILDKNSVGPNDSGDRDVLGAMIEYYRKTTFGYDRFRPIEGDKTQKDAILTTFNPASKKQDLILLAATGRGKSAVFQIPAMIRAEADPPEATLILSPLIALMRDQERSLLEKGAYYACAVHSNLDKADKKDRLNAFRKGYFSILILSPEMLNSNRMQQILTQRPPALLVVDEAHCISQWGHNFRPNYLKIAKHLQEILTAHQYRTIAVTATARQGDADKNRFDNTVSDITRQLLLKPENLEIMVSDTFRPELIYRVIYLAPQSSSAKANTHSSASDQRKMDVDDDNGYNDTNEADADLEDVDFYDDFDDERIGELEDDLENDPEDILGNDRENLMDQKFSDSDPLHEAIVDYLDNWEENLGQEFLAKSSDQEYPDFRRELVKFLQSISSGHYRGFLAKSKIIVYIENKNKLNQLASLIQNRIARKKESLQKNPFQKLGIAFFRPAVFHADIEKEQPNVSKKEIQQRFFQTCEDYDGALNESSNHLNLILATSAFGMGIDQQDIRCVIHGGLRSTLEAYYQEAGRAGRDGNPALCVLFTDQQDINRGKKFQPAPLASDIRKVNFFLEDLYHNHPQKEGVTDREITFSGEQLASSMGIVWDDLQKNMNIIFEILSSLPEEKKPLVRDFSTITPPVIIEAKLTWPEIEKKGWQGKCESLLNRCSLANRNTLRSLLNSHPHSGPKYHKRHSHPPNKLFDLFFTQGEKIPANPTLGHLGRLHDDWGEFFCLTHPEKYKLAKPNQWTALAEQTDIFFRELIKIFNNRDYVQDNKKKPTYSVFVSFASYMAAMRAAGIYIGDSEKQRQLARRLVIFLHSYHRSLVVRRTRNNRHGINSESDEFFHKKKGDIRALARKSLSQINLFFTQFVMIAKEDSFPRGLEVDLYALAISFLKAERSIFGGSGQYFERLTLFKFSHLLSLAYSFGWLQPVGGDGTQSYTLTYSPMSGQIKENIKDLTKGFAAKDQADLFKNKAMVFYAESGQDSNAFDHQSYFDDYFRGRFTMEKFLGDNQRPYFHNENEPLWNGVEEYRLSDWQRDALLSRKKVIIANHNQKGGMELAAWLTIRDTEVDGIDPANILVLFDADKAPIELSYYAQKESERFRSRIDNEMQTEYGRQITTMTIHAWMNAILHIEFSNRFGLTGNLSFVKRGTNYLQKIVPWFQIRDLIPKSISNQNYFENIDIILSCLRHYQEQYQQKKPHTLSPLEKSLFKRVSAAASGRVVLPYDDQFILPLVLSVIDPSMLARYKRRYEKIYIYFRSKNYSDGYLAKLLLPLHLLDIDNIAGIWITFSSRKPLPWWRNKFSDAFVADRITQNMPIYRYNHHLLRLAKRLGVELDLDASFFSWPQLQKIVVIHNSHLGSYLSDNIIQYKPEIIYIIQTPYGSPSVNESVSKTVHSIYPQSNIKKLLFPDNIVTGRFNIKQSFPSGGADVPLAIITFSVPPTNDDEENKSFWSKFLLALASIGPINVRFVISFPVPRDWENFSDCLEIYQGQSAENNSPAIKKASLTTTQKTNQGTIMNQIAAIVTTGTALLSNANFWLRNSDKHKGYDVLSKMPPEAIDGFIKVHQENQSEHKISAEINSLLMIDRRLKKNDEQLSIIHFLLSDTPEMEIVKNKMKIFFEARGFMTRFSVIRGLSDKEHQFQGQGLRALINEILRTIENYKQLGYRPVINATAGYKAESAYATIIAQMLQVECFYIYEHFADVVSLPFLPLELNVPFWSRFEESFQRFAEGVSDLTEAKELCNKAPKGFRYLVEKVFSKNENDIWVLNPAGFAFYKNYILEKKHKNETEAKKNNIIHRAQISLWSQEGKPHPAIIEDIPDADVRRLLTRIASFAFVRQIAMTGCQTIERNQEITRLEQKAILGQQQEVVSYVLYTSQGEQHIDVLTDTQISGGGEKLSAMIGKIAYP